MFDKEIEFSAHEDYYALKEDYPIPIKLNIPEWYKKLNHTIEKKTVKGCMPFLDTLTSGYLLKMPQDLWIHHNILDQENRKNSLHFFSSYVLNNEIDKKINLNKPPHNLHATFQVEGSPLVEKNKNLPFYKIANPWKIKTPKGYSCLFVPPLNNSDDRFSIISGIVDTDEYPDFINFPIVINGDKYPTLETIIKKGTPYVQVIPFKRDSWKMKTQPLKQNTIEKIWINFGLYCFKYYKDRFWKKKLWK